MMADDEFLAFSFGGWAPSGPSLAGRSLHSFTQDFEDPKLSSHKRGRKRRGRRIAK